MKRTWISTAALSLLLAGCSASRTATSVTTQRETAAAAPTGPSREQHAARTNAPAVQTEFPLVVITRADWCPACRRIEPVIKKVEEEFRDRATFVYLDLTSDATEAEAAQKVMTLGIDGFYSDNGGRTGVVAVFGRDRTSPSRVRGLDAAPYRVAIEQAQRSYIESPAPERP